jgi:hypothetical protein
MLVVAPLLQCIPQGSFVYSLTIFSAKTIAASLRSAASALMDQKRTEFFLFLSFYTLLTYF